jgi:tRNA pseudouridine55 synthase
VEAVLGEIDQNHPYSPLKKYAAEAYVSGETVEIAFRKRPSNEFEITRIDLPEIDFRVVCSKGT